MQRRLQVIGGVSEFICASRSVVPGSSFADILTRMADHHYKKTALMPSLHSWRPDLATTADNGLAS